MPTKSFEGALPDGDGAVQVRYVAPSAHVRRKVMCMDTYDKFLAAEQLQLDSREPEFEDSPFFQDRGAVLLSDLLVPWFSLGGAGVDAGDVIDIVLSAPHPMRRVRVENILILLTRGQC